MPTYDVIQIGFRVADHIQAMLAYWDKNQLCRFANRAYLEWFGKTPEEMIDKITMKDLLGPLYEQNLPYIVEVLFRVRPSFLNGKYAFPRVKHGIPLRTIIRISSMAP